MSKTLVREMPAGAVDLGGSAKAALVGYPVGAINFGPSYSAAEDAMARSIVRLECEAEELRATVAMLQEQARILVDERDEARAMLEGKWHRQDSPLIKMMNERDEARIQYRSTEALGMALVKTIDELKAEKAAIFAQLVSLQSGSRRATLDEISESVREKHDPEYEFGGREDE